MKLLNLAACLFFLSTAPGDPPAKPAQKLEPQTGDLSGIWACSGKDNAKPYSGVVTITRVGEVYVVSWLIGTTNFTGVGVRQGDSFSVGWAAPAQGGVSRGVNVYKIGDKKMAGRWSSLPGQGTIQSENLAFLKELEEE